MQSPQQPAYDAYKRMIVQTTPPQPAPNINAANLFPPQTFRSGRTGR